MPGAFLKYLECFIADLVYGGSWLCVELDLVFVALGDHVPRCGAFGVPPEIANCGNGRRHGPYDLGPQVGLVKQ